MDSYQRYSEKDLINLLRKGDQHALSSLYYMHVKQLKYYVQRTAQSPFLAEDIVHDTFIKIWENRAHIDPLQPFKPYLFTIAKRNLLNVLKRAQHETAIISEIRHFYPVEENTTELQLDYNESNLLVSEAVSGLPGKCKEVFICCRLQGKTYKQAAEEFGITESTVNKHMSQAISLIRAYVVTRNTMSLILVSIAAFTRTN